MVIFDHHHPSYPMKVNPEGGVPSFPKDVRRSEHVRPWAVYSVLGRPTAGRSRAEPR